MLFNFVLPGERGRKKNGKKIRVDWFAAAWHRGNNKCSTVYYYTKQTSLHLYVHRMPCFTQNYLAISSAICQCSAKNGKPYQFRQQPLSRYHSWNGTRLVFPEDKVRERGEGVYLFCVYSFFSWKGGSWQTNLMWNLPVPLLTLLILFKL